MVVIMSGQRAVLETTRETKDESPRSYFYEAYTSCCGPVGPPIFVTDKTPIAFEERHTGVTLEVESNIAADGSHIDLNIAPQHIERLGYQSFSLPKNKDIAGAVGRNVRLGVYFDMKTTTSLTLRSGEHTFLGVFKKEKPEGTVEIFIVGAEVIEVGP